MNAPSDLGLAITISHTKVRFDKRLAHESKFFAWVDLIMHEDHIIFDVSGGER